MENLFGGGHFAVLCTLPLTGHLTGRYVTLPSVTSKFTYDKLHISQNVKRYVSHYLKSKGEVKG